MKAVYFNLVNLMMPVHGGAFQSGDEGTGRNHRCERFCRIGEYKDIKLEEPRPVNLHKYDITGA
jgi:hypothetical protein